MRWLVFGLFMVLIALADWVMLGRQDHAPAQLVAVRTLEKNHFVTTQDVRLARFEGLYVTRTIEANHPLADLAVAPDVAAPAAGDFLASVPVDRREVDTGAINANTPVHVCRANVSATAKPVTFVVRAVLCPSHGACAALVEAPADQAAAFTTQAAAAGSPVLSAKPCG